MRDIKPLLLVLLSVGFVGTWVYHLYDKSRYASQTAGVSSDTGKVAADVRDSLQRAYSETISNLDFKLDSSQITADSLQVQLALRVNEINKLRREIGGILKNRYASKEELNLAKSKMGELENKVEQLRNQNATMEQEKEKLSSTLSRLSDEVKYLEQNIKTLDTENKSLSEKIKAASVFVASDINFSAIDIRDSKEVETVTAKKADKFVASFALQNNVQAYMNVEAVIVIVGPDGQVLQSSTWDSGSFETKTGVRKDFTRKIRFDYEKGESKKLIFSLEVSNIKKGNYNFEIWHNGVMIGKSMQSLK